MTGIKKERREPKPEPPHAHSSGPQQEPFPIVSIGASAGGLAAFEAFFSGIPAETTPAMAFVLVQHLAPDHKSFLTELIGRCTRMPVLEVSDGMTVQPGTTYIIPPNRDMALQNGQLQLIEPSEPRGQWLPIDFFFRSLAQDQRERAICIILSGTGSDGSLGLRAIKAEGGMAIVQTPESAEHDSMPRNALATGLVDYTLPPAEMFVQITAYTGKALSRHRTAPLPRSKQHALRTIFTLLRTQTGHDFSQYKPSTIQRRIERRMVLQKVETIEDYLTLMRQKPAEVEALFYDLLIGVTHFFRDPGVFKIMEKQVVPRLFAGRPADSVIRIWIPGCSTGEEAYSIAILLQEYMETLQLRFQPQIFATDIDIRSIDTARAGLYPASSVADILPERLARFFTSEPDGATYRIHKSIREMLIFSEQNVITDPPFSRIDLISCRNLLIYMDGDLQKKLLHLFHYSLQPGGLLLLGTSETVGDMDDLFTVFDRKAKVYQRKEDIPGVRRMGLKPSFPPITGVPRGLQRPAAPNRTPSKASLRELTEQALLQQVAPSAALVNAQGDILYIHGRTGMYLEPTPGETGVNNILRMAREGLRLDLSTALHNAAAQQETIRRSGLRVKTNGEYTGVDLTVCPIAGSVLRKSGERLFLVMLKESPLPAPGPRHPGAAPGANREEFPFPGADALIAALQQELVDKEIYLKDTNEALETSNEQLKTANEEMQSINEEMQSANEELETSKEELQLVNEELATVNAELQSKVTDLSRAYNDMNNLLAGSGIGTVFVDHELRILRYTPAATRIINLIPSDIGRPVSHLASNLAEYDGLVADVREVLNTLIIKETEVQSLEGSWYTMRIQPYRTLDNVIEGAVITFFDTTELRTAREAIHRLAVVVQDARDAITVLDLDGRILAWNPAATRLYGWSEAEALTMNICDLIPEDRRQEDLEAIQQISRAEILKPYSTRRIAKNGQVVAVRITSTALVDNAGRIYAIATTERAEKSHLNQRTASHDQ